MVDKLDWTVLPKDKDQLEDKADLEEEDEEDSEEEEEDSAVDKADSAVIQETQVTQQSSWARTIRTPRRVPLELSQERRSLFDDSFKNFIYLWKFNTFTFFIY